MTFVRCEVERPPNLWGDVSSSPISCRSTSEFAPAPALSKEVESHVKSEENLSDLVAVAMRRESDVKEAVRLFDALFRPINEAFALETPNRSPANDPAIGDRLAVILDRMAEGASEVRDRFSLASLQYLDSLRKVFPRAISAGLLSRDESLDRANNIAGSVQAGLADCKSMQSVLLWLPALSPSFDLARTRATAALEYYVRELGDYNRNLTDTIAEL